MRLGWSGWNRFQVGGAIPDDELLETVDESHTPIVGTLPRKHRPEGGTRPLGASEKLTGSAVPDL